ncbi:MAG: hypothetical protein ACPG7R_08520, partial [Planctomycetota bacterium]
QWENLGSWRCVRRLKDSDHSALNLCSGLVSPQHAGIQNPHFYKNAPKLLLPNNLPIYFRPVDLSELSSMGEFTVY